MRDRGGCTGETLCWRCRRPGTGTCSWDKSLTPVCGWDAVAVPWREAPGKYQMTWHVNGCPLFDPEPDYGRRMKNASLSARGKAPGRPPKIDWRTPEVGTLFRCGWSDRAVAERFGLSAKTAARYREKWEAVWEAEAAEARQQKRKEIEI